MEKQCPLEIILARMYFFLNTDIKWIRMLFGKSISSPISMERFSKLRSRTLTHYFSALAACTKPINIAKIFKIWYVKADIM